MEIPRFLTPTSKPFNPIELAEATEKIILRQTNESWERKYTAIYPVGVYRGIATAYTVGCILRCYYCWVSLSRDFPEKYGEFMPPEEVVRRLEQVGRKYRYGGTHKCRISGGEPTLGKDHLLKVLELIDDNDWFNLFIFETNGILLTKEYVQDLEKFRKVYVRVSLKAGNETGFEKRTGAIGKYYDLPYKAIEYLSDSSVNFHVAAMTDSRIMPEEERQALIKRLENIDERLASNLEEEIVNPYDTTIIRLKKAGIKI